MYGIAAILSLIVTGQVPGPSGAAATPAASIEVQSVWDFVVKGGPMMIPIALCSLVAVMVIVERVISLRRARVIPAGFLPGLKAILNNGGDDAGRALEYCRNNGSAVANVLAVGIKRLSEPVELLEKHIQEAGEREVVKLRKYLRILAVVAAIAPLMGLLGTIFGMITAFQTVAASAQALGKTELLAEGIYEAMITTAAGLMVTIPVLIAYHWFSSRIEQLVSEIDRLTVEFVEEYGLTGAEEQEPALTLPTARKRPVEAVAGASS